MNHTAQNSLKASAYLLGISVEELIDVLNNASQIKEIRTTSGFPLSLPTRTGQTQPAPEVCGADDKGCGTDTQVPKKTNNANALQHQGDRLEFINIMDSIAISQMKAENARLKAEVERLTKAGDKMAKRTEFFQKRWDADELCQEVEAWNAAKEGKQS